MSSIIKVDQIQLADGSTPTAGDLGLNVTGGVLQVVQGTTITQVNSSSTSFSDTGLSASITPSSTSSKILVTMSAVVGTNCNGSPNTVLLRVLRDSTVITNQDYLGYAEDLRGIQCGASISKLDSPSTTSAITYKVQYSSDPNKNGGQVYFCTNDDGSSSNVNTQSTECTLTLIEIAG